ncbi:hypothetical protein [Halobacillus yeomjeoni]|uniref:Uncharacterized protein n=1 Tax=Halobacillus yeomjeoni TaxID=311194 RepID=A0A931HVS9_9BACI|nr:hypothetical protein [Halobacillus yeomjeoni]MBH0230705.1 hypothetical protein [Halobacillus yeomjeoni]
MKENTHKVELTDEWKELVVYATENNCSKEAFKQWLNNQESTQKKTPHLQLVKSNESR